MDDNHDPLLSCCRHHHHHVGDGNGCGIVISPKIGTSLFKASHRRYHLRQLDIGRQAEALLVRQLWGISVFVSLGIQMPNMLTAPEFRVEPQQQLKQESSSSSSSSSSSTMTSNLVDIDVGGGGGKDDTATVPSFNVQSLGHLYGSGDGNNRTGGVWPVR